MNDLTGGELWVKIHRDCANDMGNPEFRDQLRAAWLDDRKGSMESIVGHQTLREWFEHAAFDVSHLPDKITAYRGVVLRSKTSTEAGFAAVGVSWTTRPEIADFYARHKLHVHPGTPFVLKVEIERKNIVAHFTERREDELIVFGPTEIIEDEPAFACRSSTSDQSPEAL